VRRRYAAAGAGSSYPLDAWLDAAEDSLSLGLRELACRLNLASRNFDRAADNLARAAQVRLSGALLRQVVEAEGRTASRAAQAGRVPVAWTAADCRAQGPDGQLTDRTRVYLGCDGVKVPVVTAAEKQARRRKVKARRRRRGRKCRPLPRAKPGADQRYKEFKVVTLDDDACDHRLVSVTRGDCAEAGRLMRRDAGRVGLDRADDRVAVVDGAEWITHQFQQQSLPLDAVGLDFYHLAEYVHKTRRAVYGEADPADEAHPGNRGAARLLHVAKHDGYAALDEELCAWLKGLRGAKRRAGQMLLGYVTEREAMILYPEFQAAGRQIGSGPTESMCKATTQRLKGVGMRWDADNAEAIMSLEALEQSGAWQDYWDSLLPQPP
jgi:hypothetical protein